MSFARKMPSYYRLLGVRPSASDGEIQKAYRRLARELHPDRNDSPEARERFLEITAAYETLREPRGRRFYDAELVRQRRRAARARRRRLRSLRRHPLRSASRMWRRSRLRGLISLGGLRPARRLRPGAAPPMTVRAPAPQSSDGNAFYSVSLASDASISPRRRRAAPRARRPSSLNA